MAITESLVNEAEQTASKPRTSLKGLLLRWTAVGWGAGYLPWAPGTWGSVEAIVLVTFIYQVGGSAAWWIHLGATVALFAIAIPAAARVIRESGESDPQVVVIDEIVGQCFCLLWIPITWQWLVAGLVLFRVLDIWKPFPVRRLEQGFGGLGIILDDLAAAVYASVLLWAANQI